MKKPLPPGDVIREDSGPPVTEAEVPEEPIEVDVDDALIERPKDHVFEKPSPPRSGRRKSGKAPAA